MKTIDFVLIHPCNTTPTVTLEPSMYCPDATAYIIPNNENPRIYLDSITRAENQRDKAIARYDNVLKGLNYWKDRALEKI